MSAVPAMKTAHARASGTPANLLPPPQVESFVYKSIESEADARLDALADAIREELHPGVYGAFNLCWAALFGIFALTFFGSPFTMFMIAVGAITGLMYFAVPIVLSRMRPSDGGAVTFLQFLRSEFDTMTGPVAGWEALLHVTLVPAALSVGAVAIAFIVSAARVVS